MKAGIWHDFGDCAKRRGISPCHEKAVTAADNGLRDPRDLIPGFPLTEDHLGKALTGKPGVVDACESQVFDRRPGDFGEGAMFGLGRCEVAGTYSLEQRSKRTDGTRGFDVVLGQSLTFDSAKTRFLELCP